jgi:hypothetical protein
MTLPGDKTTLGRNNLLYAMFNSTGIKVDKLSIKYLRLEAPLPPTDITAYYNDKTGQCLARRPCPLDRQLRVISRCRG